MTTSGTPSNTPDDLEPFGTVRVDSATLLIVDPCYLPDDLRAKIGHQPGAVTVGEPGMVGVLVATGGDGSFPVEHVVTDDEGETYHAIVIELHYTS